MKGLFIACLFMGGIEGVGQSLPTKPDESRFTKLVLDEDLNEPMEVAVSSDGQVYYIERPGWVNRFDPKSGRRKRLVKLPVRFKGEDGLIGMALDPSFHQSSFIYLYFGDPRPVGDTTYNVLARFVVNSDSLLQSTRRDLLRIPVVAEGVSHSAGSLAFDRHGNLYLATGDNTNPFESGGYTPIDDRPGRRNLDAQRSAGNANDLRGKILRIHPEPNGTYTIPPGNLFPTGTAGTRPEIYVMGCRNPYRIGVDARTDALYWGEVGPDAGKDSLSWGPRGYDEFNRATRAGNFGWPYFVGNSKPYHRYDFAQRRPGVPFDPLAPVNESANNTGIRLLPPAQPALVWYPYDVSPEFPALGSGGRNAIGGPIFYTSPTGAPERQFPPYYNGAWFIADWMRNWLFTARLDTAGRLIKVEPFLSGESFSKPIDMTFGPDGALYLLEYGTYWLAKNTDARLVRIDYTEGNRVPVAKLSASQTVGAAPLRIKFSAAKSFDYDPADSLTFRWQFTGKAVQATGPAPVFTFTKPGVYPVRLTVTDKFGSSAATQQLIRVGNAPPTVRILVKGNRSFYSDARPLPYQVAVRDHEDGILGKTIPVERVRVTEQYLPTGYDFAGLDVVGDMRSRGQMLLEGSDCQACHAKDRQSIGPSLLAVAGRYDTSAIEPLTQKVINGGGGVWGREHVMSAHPQLSQVEVREMIRYILSLKEAPLRMATRGVLKVNSAGRYLLTAEYTDQGGLVGRDAVLLRPPRLLVQEASASKGVARQNLSASEAVMAYNESGAWLAISDVDLTGIQSISVHFNASGLTGNLDLRLDSPTGLLIAQLPVEAGLKKRQTPLAALIPTKGQHTLYVVYKEQAGNISIWKRLEMSWIEFHQ